MSNPWDFGAYPDPSLNLGAHSDIVGDFRVPGRRLEDLSVNWGGTRLRFDRPAVSSDMTQDMYDNIVELYPEEPSMWAQVLPWALGLGGIGLLYLLWRK